jgi:hypothetical protein
VLEAIALRKEYGSHVALDSLSLTIAPGEVFCLLGANGAGKTTTINLFLNFIDPTGGTARIKGLDVTKAPLETKKHVAYIPEQVMLYRHLTGVENRRRGRARCARPGQCQRIDRCERRLAGCGVERANAGRRHRHLLGGEPRRRAQLRGAGARQSGGRRGQRVGPTAAASCRRARDGDAGDHGRVDGEVRVGDPSPVGALDRRREVVCRRGTGSRQPGGRQPGWESAAVTANGDIVAAWLDHRDVPVTRVITTVQCTTCRRDARGDQRLRLGIRSAL